jgi:hypothetical protein
MTEPAAAPASPLPERAAPAPPKLVHSGLYTLWETPEGGRVLIFKRLHTRDPVTGKVVDIHQPKDERLPEVPADALPLVSMWLDNGFPPAILAMIKAGRANPLAMIKQLRDMAGAVPGPGAEGGQDGTP